MGFADKIDAKRDQLRLCIFMCWDNECGAIDVRQISIQFGEATLHDEMTKKPQYCHAH